jgi:ribosomal protein S18 acetylase RimI-like enzyme
MNIRIQNDCLNINWDNIPEILRKVGMGYHETEMHKKAFENSYAVVFVFSDDKLIGFGRAISDGVYQAGLYDIAVLPDFQGKGIGSLIVENILKAISNCNVILYAATGKEKFYEKLGFRKMKTGMALFVDKERMRVRGFTE